MEVVLFFLSLLSLPLTHLTLFFSFPFSPHSLRSTLSQSWSASLIQQSNQPLWSNTVVIPTDHENNGPWFRSASLIFDHMKTIGFLGGPWSSDPRPWLNERWWFWRVCSIWSLMVAGGWWLVAGCGWFWLYVGFVARQKRR